MTSAAHSTATAAIPETPSAQEYSQAFYGLEDRIARLFRLAKLANHLTALVIDDLDAPTAAILQTSADYAWTATQEVERLACELDDAFLASFNDLVAKENAAYVARRQA